VNDTYGHEAGDIVLQSMAMYLRKAFRTTDTITRMGGEEFLVIATEVNPVHLFRLTDRVRETISEIRFKLTDGQEIGITCSFGVTYALPGPALSVENCIAIADKALYESKNNGRNRVTVHHPTSEKKC
jgi:diguanylate cyclase (GGDEF)-like protein